MPPERVMRAARRKAVFLDFATLGPGVDTRSLDTLLDVCYHPVSSAPELAARLAGCTVALLNKTRLDATALAAARDLKLVVLAATGTDNVDLDAARRHGIAVANIRNYCTTSVVQHVLALVLALTQQPHGYDDRVRRGDWSRSPSFAMFDFPIRELAGRNFGVVGYGTLGQAVARAASCLGMRVLVAARPDAPAEEIRGAKRVAFGELLGEADVLSLHCPLTAATRHLIGASELRAMRSDAILINTARGALIDGVALVAALRSGEIGGAGIDVLPSEPPPVDDPLLEHGIPNLIVTPHIAWAAREARQRAIEQVAENVESFLAGGSLRRVV
jgi:glycerate dehydrogenase